MVSIHSIQLNDQTPLEFSPDGAYIFGGNSTGKTILVEIIDYMLGSSRENVWNLQGTKGIQTIKMVLRKKDTEEFLFLKREQKQYSYSYRKEGPFVPVDRDAYCTHIRDFFCTPSSDLVTNYYTAVEEKLTHRSISYLNFIKQYSLGDCSNVIPEANEVDYYSRIKKQTLFFFAGDHQKNIDELETGIACLEKKIDAANQSISRDRFARETIQKEFGLLGLESSGDLHDDFEKYLAFKKGEKTKKRAGKMSPNLRLLLERQAFLRSQISIQRAFERQTTATTESNKAIDGLLSYLNSVLGADPRYQAYAKTITEEINEHRTRSQVLSIVDYPKTIDSLNTDLMIVNDEIERIRQSISEKDYVEFETAFKTIEKCFSMLGMNEKTVSEADVAELRKQKKDLCDKLQKENKAMKVQTNSSVDDFITQKYLGIPFPSNFLKEDLPLRPIISFNPYSKTITGKRLVQKQGHEFYENYVPGSKARQTCWQVLCILAIHLFLKKTFPTLPLFPVLVIDGLSEPFDEESDFFLCFYDYLRSLASEHGIQLIVTSTKRREGDDVIDISKGLNSDYPN